MDGLYLLGDLLCPLLMYFILRIQVVYIMFLIGHVHLSIMGGSYTHLKNPLLTKDASTPLVSIENARLAVLLYALDNLCNRIMVFFKA